MYLPHLFTHFCALRLSLTYLAAPHDRQIQIEENINYLSEIGLETVIFVKLHGMSYF